MVRATYVLPLSVCALLGLSGVSVGQFVNWETPHVHPMDITPDAGTLLVFNLADNRLEVFDVSSGTPIAIGSIPVGLDPISVRARTDTEAWVVNHISDSISVVNATFGTVTVEPNQSEYLPCMVVTLTAEPNDGKIFTQWRIFDPNHPGDANYATEDTNTVLQLVMGEDWEVQAGFKCGSSLLPPLAAGALCLVAFGLVRRRVTG